MVWTTLALILTTGAVTAALWKRGSGATWIAASAMVLAVLSFLGGFSIGWAIAPFSVLLLGAATLSHLRGS